MFARIVIAFFAASLAACSSQHEIVPPAFGSETDVPGILVGMTPDAVINVLGSDYDEYPGSGFSPPSSFSYPYIDEGIQKFTIVEFKSGHVWYAHAGQSEPVGIFYD